jgi:hypothetical protein
MFINFLKYFIKINYFELIPENIIILSINKILFDNNSIYKHLIKLYTQPLAIEQHHLHVLFVISQKLKVLLLEVKNCFIC